MLLFFFNFSKTMKVKINYSLQINKKLLKYILVLSDEWTSDLIKLYSSAQKFTYPIPPDKSEVTPLLWLMTYVIYVNHILGNNAHLINKKYLHFSFNFHFSFHFSLCKYLNWLAQHVEMFWLLFLCLWRSVEFKVINNGGWIAWKNVWKTDLSTAQITNLFWLKGKIFVLLRFLKLVDYKFWRICL